MITKKYGPNFLLFILEFWEKIIANYLSHCAAIAAHYIYKQGQFLSQASVVAKIQPTLHLGHFHLIFFPFSWNYSRRC